MSTVPYPLSAYGLAGEITLPVGFTAVYPFTIQQGYDTAVTIFTGADTLTASVWPGDDIAASFTPTVAWVVAASGTATLTILGASTAALASGSYKLSVSVTVSGAKYLIHEGTLTLTAVAGSGTQGTVYCTFDDMQREFATIGGLASKSDQSGFREQRAEARAWFDSIILRHYMGQQTVVSQTRFNVGDSLWQRNGLEDQTIRGYLDDDLLLVTLNVKRATALYATYRVLAAQIGASGDSQYGKLAGRFLAMAESIVANTTAEIDTNSDDIGDIPIDLGVIDVLRG